MLNKKDKLSDNENHERENDDGKTSKQDQMHES